LELTATKPFADFNIQLVGTQKNNYNNNNKAHPWMLAANHANLEFRATKPFADFNIQLVGIQKSNNNNNNNNQDNLQLNHANLELIATKPFADFNIQLVGIQWNNKDNKVNNKDNRNNKDNLIQEEIQIKEIITQIFDQVRKILTPRDGDKKMSVCGTYLLFFEKSKKQKK